MSEQIYNFSKSLINGNKGERIIINWLLFQPFSRTLKNVTSNKYYQKRDIDLLLTTNIIDDKKTWAIEIKTDSYRTGNLFWEVYSCLEYQTLGCLEKTESDILAYFFINEEKNQLYLFNTKKLRNWVHKNMDSFSVKTVKNKTYSTFGVLIPLTQIPAKFYRKETINKFYYE